MLSQNIYSKIYNDKFLIAGTCLYELYPDAMLRLSQEFDDHVVNICLEQFHYNQFFSKLIDILSLGKTKKVGFVTVDGSPHCVSLHYASKYLQRALKVDIEYIHYVIDQKGDIYKVERDVIDNSRIWSPNSVKI